MSKNKNTRSELSENLSHELLTPLAVIQSKAELLLQSPNLMEKDLNYIDDILKMVYRMSRINKSLILLSKIDNKIFVDEDSIDLKNLIQESIGLFQDQIRAYQIKVKSKIESEMSIKTNFTLFEILITNLVKNAVMHNQVNGFINIHCTRSIFTIMNSTGGKVPEDPFKRFQSGSDDKNSVGLGLEIVKRICTYLNIKFDYQANENEFIFSLYYN